MNTHNRFRNIYFARVGAPNCSVPNSLNAAQSGQSLIEHSYRADSDLSPSGWAYAETLKDFVIRKYHKSLAERGIDGKSHRLVVCYRLLGFVLLKPHGIQIWTSARMRCSHTAWPFLTGSTSTRLNVKIIEKQQMSEINPGAWDGLTPEQVTALPV